MVALAMVLSGCVESLEITDPKGFSSYTPTPMLMRDIPEGQDSFSIGWREGCNTYLGFTGSGFLQMRSYTYDVNRSLTDKMYAAGFREGASYCMYYTDTRPN